ncbi:hypothetical protein HYN59_17280 [Flavobacterium album]|uniref:Uncharacterized protein n=1 Tax=Flavobacterium album TaxID=2175091 RepID=A0A2S1R205_9FLAO|nr:hypothetical protein [Flavobacterium album]AWH86753.1 hypothetical protein HYN59_17280 [Flavobacterium album]
MARRLELFADKENGDAPAFSTNFDNYGVILYYAFTVNKEKAILLYKAMVNKYHYALGYDLPLNGLSDNNTEVCIPIEQIPDVMSFITNDILPSLYVLPLDLNMIDEWNTGEDLETFLMNQGSFFDTFNIDGIVVDNYTVDYFIRIFNKLFHFFEQVFFCGTSYKVEIA